MPYVVRIEVFPLGAFCSPSFADMNIINSGHRTVRVSKAVDRFANSLDCVNFWNSRTEESLDARFPGRVQQNCTHGLKEDTT